MRSGTHSCGWRRRPRRHQCGSSYCDSDTAHRRLVLLALLTQVHQKPSASSNTTMCGDVGRLSVIMYSSKDTRKRMCSSASGRWILLSRSVRYLANAAACCSGVPQHGVLRLLPKTPVCRRACAFNERGQCVDAASGAGCR